MKHAAILLVLASAAAVAADKPRSFHAEVRGHGAPMILIPGLSSSPEVWKETVDRYKDRYECHLITLAGFVGKPPIEAPFLDTVRKDLLAYIRDKKLKKPVLVGHSLGGFLSLWMAATDPEMPGKLLIVDALPYLAAIMNESITPEAARAMGEMMRQQILKAAPGSNTNWSRGMAAKPEDTERIVAWGKQSNPQAIADAMYEMWTNDLRPELAKIKAPALVLGTWIAHKDYSTREQVEANFQKQYATLKGVRIQVFDTARHFIMWDDPQGFFAASDKFLGVQ